MTISAEELSKHLADDELLPERPIEARSRVEQEPLKAETFSKIALLGTVILAIGAVGVGVLPGCGGKVPPAKVDSGTQLPTAVQTAETAEVGAPYEFVDSQTVPWARPTPGQPVSLRHAPAGVQLMVRLRLSKLLAHSEGRKILRSLGPKVDRQLSDWLQRVGVQGEAVEVLSLYLLPQGSTLPQLVAVGQLHSGQSQESLLSFKQKNEDRIAGLATDAVWFPEDDRQVFVFGPKSVLSDLRQQGLPVLSRELEQLRRQTHDTDDVSILLNPNFLRDEAQGLFSQRRLLTGLYDFWSEQAQAVAIGVQLGEVAVAEARMIAREDLPPRRFAGRVQRKLEGLPATAADFLGRVELDPHWQPLALRFPTMVHFLVDQTRVALEGKQVVVSSAVPVEAVHNLLLATELSLASTIRPEPMAVADRSAWTIDQLLAAKMSVRFAQKSLESALRDIAQQVNDELPGLPFQFSVEIIGTDLETEGITRNQQIRDFAEADKPLAEILTSVVTKANPVQSVSRPSENEQRLVWVVSPDTPGKIIITTRAATNERQLVLPAIFNK